MYKLKQINARKLSNYYLVVLNNKLRTGGQFAVFMVVPGRFLFISGSPQ